MSLRDARTCNLPIARFLSGKLGEPTKTIKISTRPDAAKNARRAFRTTTYPDQITPYASAASLSDSDDPASSASSSSSRPSVIVSRTADTL